MKKDVINIKEALGEIDRLKIRLATVNTLSKIVSSGLNLDEILRRTIDIILGVPGLEGVRIYVLNNGGKVLNLVAHKGLSTNFTDNLLLRPPKPGNGLLWRVLLGGEAKTVDIAMQSVDPDADLLIKEGFQSAVYIPLTARGTSIGVMCVSSLNPDTFSSEIVEFLTAVGNHIGVAVDNTHMHKNMKEAYQNLKAVQEQIVWTEKLASLGKLAATIAHEINNPLAGVLNYIRLIIKQLSRNRLSQDNLENISRYLAIMESETARCGEIVKDLLAFARRTKITMENNRIESIVDRTLSLISHELEIRELQLKKDIAPNLPTIKCDFKQIQQVLLNLVYNAIEAMQRGGTLTLTANRADGAEPFLEIGISDTGCGISKKDMEKIFEPFFTTKTEGKGVGLGLSVVYGIIAGHNGTISVESEPGKGSTFTVRLPFA